MSETPPDAPPPPRYLASMSLRELLIVIGIIAALISLLIGGPLEQLLFGWLYFPFRVLPQITVDWPSASLGLISTAIFCAGLHVTIRWFLQQTAPRAWPLRATLVVAGTLVLMFTAGTAMVGATHQALWLAFGKGGEAQPARTTGLLGGGVFGAREAARQSQQRNVMRFIGTWVLNFEDYDQRLPPGGSMTADGQLLHGWAALAMTAGYYSDDYGSDRFNWSIPWKEPPNRQIYRCVVPDFINPAMPGPYFDDEGFGYSHLSGNIRVLTLQDTFPEPKWSGTNHFQRRASNHSDRKWAVQSSDITDGAANTLLIGTVGAGFKPWGHPANLRDPAAGINRGPQSFGGPPHWRGAMFLMCDGSVRMLSETTDPQVLKALATPDGGETVPAEP